MPKQITPTNFIATVYGNLTPLNNSAFSKARLKIFYKGLNRNGSYITDEIAEKMLATLPGSPIVGFFDGDLDDFSGHMSPETSKPYGFVPQDMNFNWEMSLDPDGVYRTYACADIILWTGRYPVASRIVGKSHSMELNPDTVQGEWVDDEEIGFYFKFTNAEFFGLCVLGEEYEPCFEGSSFYELNQKKDGKLFSDEVKEMFTLYKDSFDIADENQTGGQGMEEEINSVEEEVVETPTTEEVVENKEEVEKTETEVPAIEEEVVEENNEEETNSEEEEVETETNSEEEKPEEEVEEETETETEEVEEEETEKPDLNSQLAEKDAEIAELKAQLEELNTYKTKKVLEEKEKVLETYTGKLTEEEVNEFKNKINDYETAADLKKEIAVCILDKEVVEEQEELQSYTLVNSRKEQLTGAAAIVAKYANKK